MVFRVVDASGWAIAGIETEGLTPHPWLRDPETSELWLWKHVAPARAHRREHWAEKILSELARMLQVPVVDVELAVHAHSDGCLSRNVRPHGWTIHAGAELISARESNFDARAARPVGYVVDTVASVLAGKTRPLMPAGLGLPTDLDAFDVFVGCLMLDALVGNGDRHARNWAILRSPDGQDAISPFFDNASGLGLDLADDRRAELLARPSGVQAWVERGKARAWTSRNGGALSLLGLLEEAWSSCSPGARAFWSKQVRALEVEAVDLVLGAVPGMSDPTRTFALEVVRVNKGRILNACTS